MLSATASDLEGLKKLLTFSMAGLSTPTTAEISENQSGALEERDTMGVCGAYEAEAIENVD